MGGGYALDVALPQPTLRAAVIHYGHLAADRESMKQIGASFSESLAAETEGLRSKTSEGSSRNCRRMERR
jgi:dienelactone hydrolase